VKRLKGHSEEARKLEGQEAGMGQSSKVKAESSKAEERRIKQPRKHEGTKARKKMRSGALAIGLSSVCCVSNFLFDSSLVETKGRSRPVFNLKPFDSLELTGVVCYKGAFIRQSCSGYQDIIGTDRFASILRVGAKSCRAFHVIISKRQNIDRGSEIPQLETSFLRGVRLRNTDFQFKKHDGGNSDAFWTSSLFETRASSVDKSSFSLIRTLRENLVDLINPV
jgi:hypothetical protein